MSLLERRVLWTMRHVEKPVNDRGNLLAVMTIAPSALDYALKRLVEQGYVKKFADGDDRAEFYALTVDGWDVEKDPRQ